MSESRITRFAFVLVPLALPKTLIYRVPYEWNEEIQPGMRVIVPIGNARLYTGVVRELTETPPEGYTARYIEGLLDEFPLVSAEQFAFWDWMAAYYCCTPGEVMNAALPGGLKLSSETRIALVDDDWMEDASLSDREREILEAVKEKPCTLQELSERLGIRTLQPILKGLIERGLIYSEEEVRERYRTPVEEIIELHPDCKSDEKLRQAFAELERFRAVRQSDALLAFLSLSGYDQGESRFVLKKELLAHQGVKAEALRSLEEKNVLVIRKRRTPPFPDPVTYPELPELSGAQQRAYEAIRMGMASGKPVTLLHGLTSSGKTEVYCHLIRDVLREGRQVLFLLPEIALTTHLITRLRHYFGSLVGVYHSGYSENQRSTTWMSLIRAPERPALILGARSALFLPFRRPGLVIVDEEHDTGFKQHEPNPRYHARDSAIAWAMLCQAPVVLGSATPSVESYWNARQGRYNLVELFERFGGAEMPEIQLADIRQELLRKTMRGNFTSILSDAIQSAKDRKEQVILFQNRRGYAPLWQCHSCGWVPMCTRCDVSLTYHKHNHQLKCHYCGYTSAPPASCVACGNHDLRMLGFGTEKLEEEVKDLFPETTVQRMDLETTRSKSGLHRIISEFESGAIQVLVGTQMVTKGLDFDHVSVVGIMNADRMLNFPDFRATERSFQLMVQVAGRAGRRNKKGYVIIQTYNPSHWIFDLVRRSDYAAFFEREIAERQQFGYPPFVRLVRITIRHRDDEVAEEAGRVLATRISVLDPGQVLGPERPHIPRINTYFLRQILVKLYRTPSLMQTKERLYLTCRELVQESGFKSVRLTIDVDPV